MTPGIERYIRYLDSNVLEAARERIRHVMGTFDSWAVAFSGGKDSLVTLSLVRQEMDAAGMTQPLEVIFRDEELIPDAVVDMVDSYRRQTDRFRLRWYAVPMASHKYILGRTYDYIQWDPARAWVRPKPDWAITEIPGQDGRVYSQYDMDAVTADGLPGKVAVFTGIRASESLVRLRACLNKIHENYITAVRATERVKLVKPIYDWSEADVFRFLYDYQIRYCAVYDAQTWNGEGLRVSTPIHAETSKRIHQLRLRDPEFYDRVTQIFPEVLAHTRYFRDLDVNGSMAGYPGTWSGILQWIDDHLEDPHQRALAKKRVADARSYRLSRNPASEPPFYGYPIRYVFKAIMSGNFKRFLLPKRHASTSRADYEFEGLPWPTP
jgi:predicted phosphoadenosine phosphosulfate sulfurtransferase